MRAQDVDQELGQFKGDRAQEFGPLAQGSQHGIFEEHRVEVANHGGATAAGSDDRVTRPLRTNGSKMSRKRSARMRFVSTGVERGLAATSLLLGKDHFNAVAFQQLHRRHAHIGIQHIDHAGHKQRHAPQQLAKIRRSMPTLIHHSALSILD
ncbi:MAG: hypothetical protein R2854_01375 [Caldilineaceae bacterium]